MTGTRTGQKYTLGLIFDSELKNVLLVHKQRPEWQKGKINGVGGKYENGETAEMCIRRETREEAVLDIPESEWIYIGNIRQEAGNVGILTVKHTVHKNDAFQNDHEEIEWFAADNLPENSMGNLRWLIPLSLERLQNNIFATFTIRY